MILDNETQRKQLISVIDMAPVQGSHANIKQAVAELDALRQQVEQATIAGADAKTSDPFLTGR